MNVHLISVPYDTAERGVRMGAGPPHLLASGATDRLASGGHRVQVEEVAVSGDARPAEIATAFELQRGVAAAVRRAVSASALPIVLSGNCNMAAVGSVAGLATPNLGVLWLDAHGDFNTPETTAGGFLDGMALAMVTGRCWREMLARVDDFVPLPEANVALVGARDLDPLEASHLTQSAVTVIRPPELGEELEPLLDRLEGRVDKVYVHLDLDVLDPAVHGRANSFAVANGLTVEEVALVIDRARHRFEIGGASITAFDPACDDDGRMARAALTLLETLATTAATHPLATARPNV